MPRIPLGNESGLGEARYQKTGSTPALGRPVQQEVGPKREVYARDVVRRDVAPLSNFKPVLPSASETAPIQHGLDTLTRHAERLHLLQQEEVNKVNDAAEKTKLLVTMGDSKSAYTNSTMEIINSPDLADDEKAKNLQKLEDDFRATITDVDPKFQPVVASEVMGTIGSVKVKAAETFMKNKQDGIRADLSTRAEQLTLEAATTGDLDGALLQFDVLHGAFRSAGLTDAHFTTARHTFEQGILQNDIMGNLKTVDAKSGAPALEAVTGILNRLNEKAEDGTPANWPRLDPATRNADIAAALQKKNQIEADLAANSNKALTQLKSSFSVGMAYYTDALKNGDPVPANLSVDLHKQAQAMVQLDPDKSTGYMGLLQLQKAEREYGPGFRAEQAAKDPLFGSGVQPLSFADTSSPDALQAAFSERVKMGQAVKEAKGLTFVPMLRNADMEGIARTVETSPANGIRMVDALKTALGKDGTNSLTYLAGQMANSKDPAAPAVAAIIYNVAKGDFSTAQVLATGMEAMKTKAITMPKDADLRDRFNNQIGDALSENSANRGINYEAYKTAYVALAARKGIVDGSFDRTTADEAFKRTVGTVARWNGSDVLVPETMDEDEFRNYLNSITPETIGSWGGIRGMKNERAAEFLKDDAQLRAVSPGRFVVEYDGKQAITAGGRLFIIDVNTPILNPRQAAGPEGVVYAGP